MAFLLASIPELGSLCLRACQAAYLAQVWPAPPSCPRLGLFPRVSLGTSLREAGGLQLPRASRCAWGGEGQAPGCPEGEAGAQGLPLARGSPVTCGPNLTGSCAKVQGTLHTVSLALGCGWSAFLMAGVASASSLPWPS